MENIRKKFVYSLFEILYKTPISVIKITIDVFPLETSGKDNPVGGILPVTTSALIID